MVDGDADDDDDAAADDDDKRHHQLNASQCSLPAGGPPLHQRSPPFAGVRHRQLNVREAPPTKRQCPRWREGPP